MFRRPLMVLLGLGVVFGYGGAFASFRHHRGGECHGWQDRSEWQRAERTERTPQTATPVIVQAPAPAAVSPVVTPQVFIIMPGANQPAPAVALPAVTAPVAAKTE